MKKINMIIILGLIAGIVWYLANSNKEVHYHAGFLVYIDGKLQDFSDNRFMHIEPCQVNEEKHIDEDPQIEKAHLHDNVGDVVHIHRSRVKWEDLFTNINFNFPKDKKLTGYLNGQKIENILQYRIKPYNSIIIVVGETNNIDLGKYVTREYIEEIEKSNENC